MRSRDRWAEQYVDRQLDEAWLAFRLDLGERFARRLHADDLETIDIEGPGGESVSVLPAHGWITAKIGDDVAWHSDNVDEAAYLVAELARDRWQVIHPAFLVGEAVGVPATPAEAEPSSAVVVPDVAWAESEEQLQAWVEATFREGRDEPLTVWSTGEISWLGERGGQVVVSVRSKFWVEVWAVLAEDVSFTRAHVVADRLAASHPTVRFLVSGGRLLVSRVVDAGPYVAGHLRDALATVLDLADELHDIGDQVTRPRAVDPALMALLPSARRVPVVELAELVRRAAGSERTLRTWREVVLREREIAKQPTGDAALDDVHRRLRSAWRRLGWAIEAALGTQARSDGAA